MSLTSAIDRANGRLVDGPRRRDRLGCAYHSGGISILLEIADHRVVRQISLMPKGLPCAAPIAQDDAAIGGDLEIAGQILAFGSLGVDEDTHVLIGQQFGYLWGRAWVTNDLGPGEWARGEHDGDGLSLGSSSLLCVRVTGLPTRSGGQNPCQGEANKCSVHPNNPP